MGRDSQRTQDYFLLLNPLQWTYNTQDLASLHEPWRQIDQHGYWYLRGIFWIIQSWFLVLSQSQLSQSSMIFFFSVCFHFSLAKRRIGKVLQIMRALVVAIWHGAFISEEGCNIMSWWKNWVRLTWLYLGDLYHLFYSETYIGCTLYLINSPSKWILALKSGGQAFPTQSCKHPKTAPRDQVQIANCSCTD